MSRMIDADVLETEGWRLHRTVRVDSHTLEYQVKQITKVPTAQPEIILCKDCKYASPNGKYGCKAYHFKLYETHEMGADDFCSRAERRTDVK